MNLTIYLLSITTNLLLGIFVFWSNRKERINQIFFFLTLSITGWLITLFLFYAIESPKWILWIGRINFAAVLPLLYYLLRFAEIFPREVISIPKLLKPPALAIWIILFATLTIFTPLVDKAEIITGPGERETVYGPLYFLYVLHYVIFAGVALVFLFYKLRKSKDKIERYQIEYMLLGLGLALFLGFTTNILLPLFKMYETANYGPLAPVIFIGFTSYAIVARRLFDIKVILTEVFTVTVALILFIQAIVASSLPMKVLNAGIFLLFCLFGYFLVRSVIREVELRQEVEKLSQAKSEFISIASHQLRTPLASIKGYISMMLEKSYGKPPTKMEKPLDNIYASNERLIKLVNDLLNLSRLEAGKIEFNPELTSLEELVSGIIEELRINAEKKGLYIKMVKPPEPLPKIMLDQDKLRQVILNIVDNAIKYTREGGITFELKKLDEQEEIKVSDTGEGMDEEEIQSLFQIFSRATAGTQLHTEGAGIGLYVAKQFVEMHGGKIWAESPGKGKGSTFIVQLPIHLSPKLLKSETITVINK